MSMSQPPPRTALMVDGSEHSDRRTHAAVTAMSDALDRADVACTTFVARDLDVDACTGCFGCWVKTPGECVFDGPSREIARTASGSDLMILVTPVTFGGYSYQAKKVLDRIVCSLLLPFFVRRSGELHHPGRYVGLPQLVALGTMAAPDADAEAVFATLAARNALNLNNSRVASAVLAGDLAREALDGVAAGLLARTGVVSRAGVKAPAGPALLEVAS